MSHPVVFAPKARTTLLSITQFIKEKWGKKQADRFRARVYKTLHTLSLQPLMFKASSIAPNVRIGTISKQISFFYQVHSNRIEVIVFFHSRQEPFLK